MDLRPVIDVPLVRRLVAAQFPQWASLEVRPVAFGGWDNRTFHLGDALVVRMPSAAGYAASVDKEQRWLPVLAPRLPLAVPVPVGRGVPAFGYPFGWSVNPWIPGETAREAEIADRCAFAVDLADFVLALQAVDATGGPAAGAHSFYRGAPLTWYDDETRGALGRHGDAVDARIWAAALAARWDGPPVWFHGDVADGNLIVREGRLSAVIDFGTSGVGDPACDVTIAWTSFSGAARAAFRGRLAVDDAMWARARGWTLWKALITLDDDDQAVAAWARRVRREVRAEWLTGHERP
jgi:aminoglycoside phosphotransferase (APT) family kinase protein